MEVVMKKLLLALSLFGVINLQSAAPARLNLENNEACNMTHSAPGSPSGRRSTSNIKGSLSVSPRKIRGVKEVNSYDVQFEDGNTVIVSYNYPFEVLKRMNSGLGERAHRFDPVYLRGNGTQALKDLMLLYDNPKDFVERLYLCDQCNNDRLQDIVYLAGLLEADKFANKLYIAFLNNNRHCQTPVRRSGSLSEVLRELKIELADERLFSINLTPEEFARIQPRLTAYQQARLRARKIFGKFG